MLVFAPCSSPLGWRPRRLKAESVRGLNSITFAAPADLLLNNTQVTSASTILATDDVVPAKASCTSKHAGNIARWRCQSWQLPHVTRALARAMQMAPSFVLGFVMATDIQRGQLRMQTACSFEHGMPALAYTRRSAPVCILSWKTKFSSTPAYTQSRDGVNSSRYCLTPAYVHWDRA